MLQRCLERLKNGRQKSVDRFRQMDDSSLVKEVMNEEWIRLSEENKELPLWRPTRESCTPFAGVRMIVQQYLISHCAYHLWEYGVSVQACTCTSIEQDRNWFSEKRLVDREQCHEIQGVVPAMCCTIFLVVDKWLKVTYCRRYHRFLPATSAGPYKHCKSLGYFFRCTILW